VTRVDEVVEVHLREQQAPVRVDAPQQPLPVQLVAAAQDQVQHVRYVGTVPLRDEQPVPQQLLRRRDPHLRARQNPGPRVLEPDRVDERQAVAGAEDQIDLFVAPHRFRDPVRLLQIRAEAGALQHPRRLDDVHGVDEEVEVLRLAVYARILVERVQPADDVGHA
jgi:hypothetical protein